MKRFLFILPVPLPTEALSNFAVQIPDTVRRSDIHIDFVGTKDGAALMDSPYESTLADAMVLEAGMNAERDGYDAVCSFSMSDSGLAALRSRLSIPVIGACEAAISLAMQLGKKFSIITMWQPWTHHGHENIAKYGFSHRLASIRHIDTRPDTQELLSGKESVVFAKLEEQALGALKQDGADVIVIGSTTMHQSHSHLVEHIPCPVVSPGLAAYKACETLVDLNLTTSRIAYPAPERLNDEVFAQIPRIFS